MQIKWSAPSQTNGVITRYEIIYQALPSGSTIKMEVPGAGNLQVVVTSLQPFTEYVVKIRAATVEWGNFSDSYVERTREAGNVLCYSKCSWSVLLCYVVLYFLTLIICHNYNTE